MIINIDTAAGTINVDGKVCYPMSNNNGLTLADKMEQYEGAAEYEGIVAEIQKWFYGYVSRTSWCATCVSYFANLLGIGNQVGKYENVDKMKENFNARGFLDCTKNYGGGNYQAKRGDVVFFSDNHTYADCTHVGVVQSINHQTGELQWIGGNTSDKIMSKTTNYLTDKYVVAFGRVDY